MSRVLGAFLALLAGTWCVGAFAQARPSMQALEAALERGTRTPLEIVWLQVAAEARMWDLRGLARTAQECGDEARPRPGCTVLGRTAWRHVFGGASQFPPESPSVARILVSALNLPRVPAEAGRFSIQGEGRLFVLMPAGEHAPRAAAPAASVVLAAGSVLTATDALHPGIAIELRAPAAEPLVIGSLRDTDLHRLVALLIRAPLGADTASATPEGIVAFRASTATPANSIAIALNSSPQPESGERLAASEEPPLPDDMTSVVAAFEFPEPSAPRGFVLADAGSIVTAIESGQALPAEPAVTGDFATLVAALESPTPAREPVFEEEQSGERLAASEELRLPDDMTSVVAAYEFPLPSAPREFIFADAWSIVAAIESGQALAAEPAITGDFTTLLAALESPAPVREPELRLAGTETVTEALEVGRRLASGSDLILQGDLSSILAAVETPERGAAPRREFVAVVATAPAPVAPAPAVGRSVDIERLRAEVEAEVRREQERLAQRAGSGAGRRFQLGV